MKLISAFVIAIVFAATAGAQRAPDLARLKESGYIMGPGNTSHTVSDSWKNVTKIMKTVSNLDAAAQRIENIVCGNEQNKSILIVGEPSQAYNYLFARVAGGRAGSLCKNDMWHVEINVSKIESGHMYVGQVDQYWNQEILAPADRANVVLYLPSIGNLIGIGSHSNDDTGIEREYIANIISGRLRSVAFIDKYEYNDLIRSKHSYVLESFADKIILPSFDDATTTAVANAFLKNLYPWAEVSPKDMSYIIKQIAFYQPNRQEPDRTMSVMNALIRGVPGGSESKPEAFDNKLESKHPYDVNAVAEWTIENKNFSSIALEFQSFDVEQGYDYLEVYDMATDTPVLLTKLTGALAANFQTEFFPTNKLKLILRSDSANVRNGFLINRLFGKKIVAGVVFNREQIRNAVLTTAQVPKWLIERNYSVVKNLEANLNSDVVGVVEGKRDLVRLAKNGYVAGRTDEKPIATALLTGPTGTGKSYIAKKMADFMEMKLVTIDMTTYKESSSFKSFQEVMSRNLTNTPYAMYLFEEIDKASIEVLDQLYFMMDEGVFYDPYQRPLFARGAFIMMTTNAASDVILNNPDSPTLRDDVMKDLKSRFRPSFLNRFDAISIFKPFNNEEFNQLARTLANKKIKKIKEAFEWTITADAETYNFISVKGRSAEFGARPMERLVEGMFGTGIAEYQLTYGVIPDLSAISFNKVPGNNNQFTITIGANTLTYTVYTELSQIFSSLMLDNRMQKFFESIRMY